MLKTINKAQKAFLAAIAVGIIVFAVYGSYNIAKAVTGSEQTTTTDDNTVLTNTSDSKSINHDGTICISYSCIGCNGCTNPQYQQVITTTYDSVTESGQSY